MKEARAIRGPIGLASEADVEARWNLPAEGFPVAVDVAGPRGRGIALLAGECGASESNDAFVGTRGALAFVK